MDVKLSIVESPVSYTVYSSLSFFGPHVEGELPGTWFVAALGQVGHEAAAVRQTLWRMERSGELHGRSEGRQRFYRFTPLAQAEAALGLARMQEHTGTRTPEPSALERGNHPLTLGAMHVIAHTAVDPVTVMRSE